MIKQRTQFIKSNDVLSDGWWFQELENKIAGYFYAAKNGFNPPEMFLCSSDIPSGLDGLDTMLATSSTSTSDSGGGFVIRVTNLHSSAGVYVFPYGFDDVELIRGITMSIEDVKSDLVVIGATQFFVKEFIHGKARDKLPTEYKFHMFNGKVGSINVVYGSGTDCGCWAEIDTDGNRLDRFG